MNKYVAVVEDDPDIMDLISIHLGKEQLRVRGFLNGSSFLRSLDSDLPALVVLDLTLPDMDGFELCRLLKAKPAYASIPIIILTARSEEKERVLGLELGADDYVIKPFSQRELGARVKVVLRRTVTQEAEAEKIEVGGLLKIDPRKYEVTVEGEKVRVTATEFRILHLLASKNGWMFSRDKILTHLWGSGTMVLDRTVDVHIKHLRDKMGKAAPFIKHMRGVGYKIEV